MVTKLQIANNKLGDAGAKKIAECIEGNKTLTSLSLHGNEIGADGGMAFARAIAKNGALTSLYLSDNQMDAATNNALNEANNLRTQPMSGLCGLVLGENAPLTGVQPKLVQSPTSPRKAA